MVKGKTKIPNVGEVVDLNSAGIRGWLRDVLAEALRHGGGFLHKELFLIDYNWPEMAMEFNQTGDENKILQLYSGSILAATPKCEPFTIVDFGGSAVNKLDTIIECLEQTRKECHYFVADTDCIAIHRAIKAINHQSEYVRASGLLGTSYSVLLYAEKRFKGPLLFISLGSSITNHPPGIVVQYLQRWGKIASGMIIGHDTPDRGIKAMEKTHHTDRFLEFLKYGIVRSKWMLATSIYMDKKWDLTCEIKETPCRHHWFLRAKEPISDGHTFIEEGHRIEVYTTFKYTEEDMEKMAANANVKMEQVFKLPGRSSQIYVMDGHRSWEFRATPAGDKIGKREKEQEELVR